MRERLALPVAGTGAQSAGAEAAMRASEMNVEEENIIGVCEINVGDWAINAGEWRVRRKVTAGTKGKRLGRSQSIVRMECVLNSLHSI